MDLRPASPMNRRTGTIDAILDSTGPEELQGRGLRDTRGAAG